MNRRKLNQLPQTLKKEMIDANMVHRHLYNANGTVIKHGVDKRKKPNHQSHILVTTMSGHYSETELVNQVLHNEMQRLNYKPVVEIDPSSVEVIRKVMTDSEKAFMLARKYMKLDPSYQLKTIWQRNRNKAICARDVKVVFELVAKIKGATKSGLA